MKNMKFSHFRSRMDELMQLPQYQIVCPRELKLVPWINARALRSYYSVETLYDTLLSFPSTVKNENALRTYLTNEQKWLPAMQTHFIEAISNVVYRYFVCDKSSIMCLDGGERVNASSAGKFM
jgi:hypothetical protein